MFAVHALVSACTATGAPRVDLGYAIYEGARDDQNDINVFKGYTIRQC